MIKGKAFTLKPASEEWLSEFSHRVALYKETQKKELEAKKMELLFAAAKAAPNENKEEKEEDSRARTSEEKYQAVVVAAKKHILKMDKKNVDFFSAATQQLVTTVLQREFGDAITQHQHFAKMQKAITSVILKTPTYKKVLKGLFDILDKSQSTTKIKDSAAKTDESISSIKSLFTSSKSLFSSGEAISSSESTLLNSLKPPKFSNVSDFLHKTPPPNPPNPPNTV